jgi:hypothetical protein
MQALQNFGLENDSLILTHFSIRDSFRMQRAIDKTNVDGRLYVLIEGHYVPFAGTTHIVYGVVTEEPVLRRWRFALLNQALHETGYTILVQQKRPPQFVPVRTREPSTAIQLSCTEPGGFFRRNVLIPYRLPVSAGTEIGSGRVKQIGDPIYFGDNNSAVVPVQFEDGTCGIARCIGVTVELFPMRNNEAAVALERSSKLPSIRNGIGSSVWHIVVYEGDEMILIKSHFNEKSHRGDVVLR